jgi:hypothetical protein
MNLNEIESMTILDQFIALAQLALANNLNGWHEDVVLIEFDERFNTSIECNLEAEYVRDPEEEPACCDEDWRR